MGDRAKHRLYAWCPEWKGYIWRDDDEDPYVVAYGYQVAEVGHCKLQPEEPHNWLWVMRPSMMSPEKWAQLFSLVATCRT